MVTRHLTLLNSSATVGMPWETHSILGQAQPQKAFPDRREGTSILMKFLLGCKLATVLITLTTYFPVKRKVFFYLSFSRVGKKKLYKYSDHV